MTNYTTKDFSQIHPPKDKPVNVGWYVTTVNLVCIRWVRSDPRSYKPLPRSCKWDGNIWRYENGDPCIYQDRYWFGLREESK